MRHLCEAAKLPIVWSMPDESSATPPADVPALPWERLTDDWAGGEAPPRRAPDGQAHLAGGVATGRGQQELAERNRRLLDLTGKLAALRELPEAAAAMVAAIREEIPDADIVIWQVNADGQVLDLVGAGVSVPRAQVMSRWRQLPVDFPLPITMAYTSGRSIPIESRAALLSQFPNLADHAGAIVGHAWVALPLILTNQSIGVIGLYFDAPRKFEADEIAHWEALSQQCAQAFERARLYSSLSASLTENARLVADLQAKDQRKNTFLAMLAHELRNPLGAMANALQLLTYQGPAESDRQARALSVMHRQVHHLRQLLDDLIDLARINQGKIRLSPEPIALGVCRGID